jgi:hypothetical protein
VSAWDDEEEGKEKEEQEEWEAASKMIGRRTKVLPQRRIFYHKFYMT